VQHIRSFVESNQSPSQIKLDLQKDGTVFISNSSKEINSKNEPTFQNLSTNLISSPELGDIMSVLLDQLDISWLDPDKSVTLEILQIISTFVMSFENIPKQLVQAPQLQRGEFIYFNISKPQKMGVGAI
jgi:hypothetical protein